MEFYKKHIVSSLGEKDGFNSRRDGILHRFAAFEHIFKTLFQFPTGWNSIREPGIYSVRLPVSIPNGMEFYPPPYSQSILERLFQFPTGWNSTMNELFDSINLLEFQFPTG